MMKTYATHMGMVLFTGALFLLVFVLLNAGQACAGAREEAHKVIYVLRQTGAGQQEPEEARSVDDTFLTAERHFRQNDREMSERYYLLTIQKARVLLAGLLARAPATSTRQPAEIPQAAAIPPLQQSGNASTTRSPSSASPTPQEVKPEEAPYPPEAGQAKPDDVPGYPPDAAASEKLVGNASVYTVAKKDTLRLVAARLGVSRQQLARMNDLDPKAALKAGQKLKYNNRKIIPQRMKNGIVINIPDRTLYYFKEGKLAASLPVALGTAKKGEKYDWKTPTGRFRIIGKQKDPTWYVPPSIQSEMEDEGKEVITSVPPGPDNPLGKYAIKTSIPGILIHSTTKPWSIYGFASHGCIRVYPEHMEGFFNEIKVNTPGEIIYRPVKLAVTEQGRIFMEVHQDAYGKSAGLDAEAKRLIERDNLGGRVDWKKVESVIRHKAGVAEDVSL